MGFTQRSRLISDTTRMYEGFLYRIQCCQLQTRLSLQLRSARKYVRRIIIVFKVHQGAKLSSAYHMLIHLDLRPCYSSSSSSSSSSLLRSGLNITPRHKGWLPVDSRDESASSQWEGGASQSINGRDETTHSSIGALWAPSCVACWPPSCTRSCSEVQVLAFCQSMR